jgi:hypothetical protein
LDIHAGDEFNSIVTSITMDAPKEFPLDKLKSNAGMKARGKITSLGMLDVYKRANEYNGIRPTVCNEVEDLAGDKLPPIFEIKRKPAVLTEKAFINRIAKLDGSISKTPIPNNFRNVIDRPDFFDFLKVPRPRGGCKVLTLRQAIFGDVNLGIEGIGRDSDYTGFNLKPYKKTDFIDFEKKTISPKLHDMVQERIKSLFDGTSTLNITEMWLKEELLPIEKVEAAMSRIFFGGDFLDILIQKMFFGHMVEHFKANHTTSPFTVGMNPRSFDPTLMIGALKRFKNDKYFCWDAKSLEVNIHSCIIYIMWKLWLKFYDKTEDGYYSRVVVCILLAQASAVCIRDGQVWQHHGGQASGNYLTIFINTFFSVCLMVMCVILHDPSIKFNEHVVVYACGDDAVAAVSDHLIASGFTFPRYQQLAKDFFGITLTDCHKKEKCEDFMLFKDIQFCSRTFQFKNVSGKKMWVMPLEKESIYGMLMWYRNQSNTEQEALEQNFTQAGIEAVAHGREFYDDLKQKVNERMAVAGYPLRFPDYHLSATYYVSVYPSDLN